MDRPAAGSPDWRESPLIITNGRLRLWLVIAGLFVLAGFFLLALPRGTLVSAQQAAKTVRFALSVAGLGGVAIVVISMLMPRAYVFADAVHVKYLFRTKSIAWDDVASITTEEVDNVATDIDLSRRRLKNQVITSAIAGVAGASDDELRGIVTSCSGATVRFWITPREARRLESIWRRHCPSPA